MSYGRALLTVLTSGSLHEHARVQKIAKQMKDGLHQKESKKKKQVSDLWGADPELHRPADDWTAFNGSTAVPSRYKRKAKSCLPLGSACMWLSDVDRLLFCFKVTHVSFGGSRQNEPQSPAQFQQWWWHIQEPALK